MEMPSLSLGKTITKKSGSRHVVPALAGKVVPSAGPGPSIVALSRNCSRPGTFAEAALDRRQASSCGGYRLDYRLRRCRWHLDGHGVRQVAPHAKWFRHITGQPFARASKFTPPDVSLRLVNMNRSASAKRCCISCHDNRPSNTTRPLRPSRRAYRSTH